MIKKLVLISVFMLAATYSMQSGVLFTAPSHGVLQKANTSAKSVSARKKGKIPATRENISEYCFYYLDLDVFYITNISIGINVDTLREKLRVTDEEFKMDWFYFRSNNARRGIRFDLRSALFFREDYIPHNIGRCEANPRKYIRHYKEIFK